MRYFRHFITRLILLGIIACAGWFLWSNRQAQAKAELALYNVQVRLAQLTGQRPVQIQKTDQRTDKTTAIKGRWPNRHATVYVNTGNSTLDAATQSAMSQWNRTGAFKFQPVDKEDNAQIVVKAMNSNDAAAGKTQTITAAMTGQITHATVFLNAYYLLNPAYGYSEQRIVNTAEHELGHAIGLNHSNHVSVMQPAGSFYTIQPADVAKVNRLYSNEQQ